MEEIDPLDPAVSAGSGVVAIDEATGSVSTPPPAPTFTELGVTPVIVDTLASRGIHTAFPIQAMAIPLALGGADLIGQARTGTGKTLGFAVPILQRITTRDDAGWEDFPDAGHPQALVVAPTRELANQVGDETRAVGAGRRARVLTIYGGRAYEPQVEELRRGVEVVVGTPGRLLDLAGQGLLDLSRVRTLVLDEADEMLDLGFLPDVERLIALTPAGRQTMLFSATMPGAVVSLARRHLISPVNLRAESAEDSQTVPLTTQFVYQTHGMDKIEILARLLQSRGRGLAMIFSRTKRTTQKVSDDLAERGFAAAAIHGDLGQGAREQALRAFRAGKVDVLVATDVAARGIDVEGVTHVVNYACPEDERTYLHRIGRTGRAGASGVAVTFVDWEDVTRWRTIDNALGLGHPVPPETYSTTPALYTDLDIPAGTKGRLPRSARTRAGLEAEQLEDLGGRDPATRDAPRTGGRGDAADRGPRGGGRGASTRRSVGNDRPDRAGSPEASAQRPTGGRPTTPRPAHSGPAGTAAPAPRSARVTDSTDSDSTGTDSTGTDSTGAPTAVGTGSSSSARERTATDTPPATSRWDPPRPDGGAERRYDPTKYDAVRQGGRSGGPGPAATGPGPESTDDGSPRRRRRRRTAGTSSDVPDPAALSAAVPSAAVPSTAVPGAAVPSAAVPSGAGADRRDQDGAGSEDESAPRRRRRRRGGGGGAEGSGTEGSGTEGSGTGSGATGSGGETGDSGGGKASRGPDPSSD